MNSLFNRNTALVFGVLLCMGLPASGAPPVKHTSLPSNFMDPVFDSMKMILGRMSELRDDMGKLNRQAINQSFEIDSLTSKLRDLKEKNEALERKVQDQELSLSHIREQVELMQTRLRSQY